MCLTSLKCIERVRKDFTLIGLVRTRLNLFLISIILHSILSSSFTCACAICVVIAFASEVPFKMSSQFKMKLSNFSPFHLVLIWNYTVLMTLYITKLCLRLGHSWLNSYANINKLSLELSFMFPMKSELRQILCGFHCKQCKKAMHVAVCSLGWSYLSFFSSFLC